MGTFSAHVTTWMEPGAAAQESTGTMTNSWILDGRFVRSAYTGDFMGQSFEGLGLTGYDTTTGTYQSHWVDSAGTMIPPTSTGSVSDDGKVLTLLREVEDPMMSGTVKMKKVLTVQDADHHTFDICMTMGGQTFQNAHSEDVRQ